MDKTIIFLKRKPQAQYHSIESLFNTIIARVSKIYTTKIIEANFIGGSPLTILKNCFAFRKDKKNDIIHITGDVHYMSLATGKRTVLTIHDVGSALKGHMFTRLYKKMFWFWLPALLVKKITVISEFTKGELQDIIPFAKEKIIVVPNPVSNAFKSNNYIFNHKLPTILCMGTKSNKNLERIFSAVTNIPCQLHVIGPLNSGQLELLENLGIHYKNDVRLSQQDIVTSYEKCDLLCFPSTYEGFGMPIIESQAVGRPVITSNLGAMLEVAQNSTCLVNPFESDSIKEGIEKIILDADYRESIIQKGFKNVERFSPDAIANQYITIYETL